MYGSFSLFLTQLIRSVHSLHCGAAAASQKLCERERSLSDPGQVPEPAFIHARYPLSLCDLGKVVLLTQPPSPNLLVELMWSSPVWVVEGCIEDTKYKGACPVQHTQAI